MRSNTIIASDKKLDVFGNKNMFARNRHFIEKIFSENYYISQRNFNMFLFVKQVSQKLVITIHLKKKNRYFCNIGPLAASRIRPNFTCF